MFNRTRTAAYHALLALVLFGASLAVAQETRAPSSTQVWINPGIYSEHFDRSKNLRNDNVGLGAEIQFNNDHGVLFGSFINSNRTRSNYATYQWRPLHWDVSGWNVSAGIVGGAFDGYPNYRNGGAFIAALPMLSVEGSRIGVNLSIIPTVANRMDGALAVQFKLRVW